MTGDSCLIFATTKINIVMVQMHCQLFTWQVICRPHLCGIRQFSWVVCTIPVLWYLYYSTSFHVLLSSSSCYVLFISMRCCCDTCQPNIESNGYNYSDLMRSFTGKHPWLQVPNNFVIFSSLYGILMYTEWLVCTDTTSCQLQVIHHMHQHEGRGWGRGWVIRLVASDSQSVHSLQFSTHRLNGSAVRAQTNGQIDGQTDLQTDATKRIISLASRSIIIALPSVIHVFYKGEYGQNVALPSSREIHMPK